MQQSGMQQPSMSDARERLESLESWVRAHLPGEPPADALALTPLPGDAGFRRYYRLNTLPSLLAVDTPALAHPAKTVGHFAALASWLRQQGISTPAVLAVDDAQGFLLLEDLGDNVLYGQLTEESAPMLYGEALMTLLTLQQMQDEPELLPRYDQATLRQELGYFDEWFVGRLLGYSINAEERGMLDRLYQALEQSAAEQPQVPVHRDYHSRNLLVRDGSSLGVVDFQDAVLGPVTYDLVSLLRDCYVRWEPEQVRNWALGYGNMALEVGILPVIQGDTFMRWFDWMGLQRHIKVLGIFARLYLRDDKPGYLKELPLVMRYTLEVAEAYPALAPFAEWFSSRLLPLTEQQGWYTDYRSAGETRP